MINKNTLLKYLGIMGLVILLSSIAVRVFNGGDTLSDYADKNPEIAYAPHAEPENTDPSQTESESTSDSAKEEMSTDSIPNVESDSPQSDSMTNGKSDHTTSNRLIRIASMKQIIQYPISKQLPRQQTKILYRISTTI